MSAATIVKPLLSLNEGVSMRLKLRESLIMLGAQPRTLGLGLFVQMLPASIRFALQGDIRSFPE